MTDPRVPLNTLIDMLIFIAARDLDAAGEFLALSGAEHRLEGLGAALMILRDKPVSFTETLVQESADAAIKKIRALQHAGEDDLR